MGMGKKNITKSIIFFVVLLVIMTSLSTPCFAANVAPYYKYHGDTIEEVIPEKGVAYYPVKQGGVVLFYVNMDDTTSLFAGDTQFVYSCKITVLLTQERQQLLRRLVKPVEKDQMLAAVGEEAFAFAETVASKYEAFSGPQTPAVPKTFPAFLTRWLGYP